MVGGYEFCCCGHPAREVRFEGLLVGVAGSDCVDGLAGLFVHDAVFEEDVCAVQETFETCLPGAGLVCLRG